ncbi:G5 domain-containing protein [Niallia sp. BSM11]|uniref:G5 domain-containing protein n=1 Tax=Niallia sp. BSM11 TaxID=3391576 RepID=UPI003984E002
MKNIQAAKLFAAILFATSFIFSFSQFGAKAYSNFFQSNDGYEEHTTIAGIDVSGMNQQEALSAVSEKHTEWEKNTNIQLKFKEKTVSFDLSQFAFQLKDAVASIKQGENNNVLVSLDLQEMESFLTSVSAELTTDNAFYLSKLNDSLVGMAASLQSGNQLIDLNEYKISKKEENAKLAEATVDTDDQKNSVKKWVKQFPTLTIKPQATISLLEWMNENNGEAYSDKVLSIVATAVHSAILPTNFTVSERYTSNTLPDFADIGYEARINKNQKMDYRFNNPNEQTFTMSFQMVNNKLYVSLNGASLLYDYKVILSDKETFSPKTVLQFDPSLSLNETRIVEEGSAGQLIKVYRESKDENGEVVKKELISEDFYPPVNKVIAHSLLVEEDVTIDADNSAAEDTDSDNSEAKTDTEASEDDSSNTKDTETTETDSKTNDSTEADKTAASTEETAESTK